MKLKDSVKMIIAFLILIAFLIIDNIYTNKSIEECINNGVNENICEELRK